MIGTVSITDLKQKPASVIAKMRSSGAPVVIIQRSEPVAVLTDPEYYRILEEALEDLEDLKAIEERKGEPGIAFEKYFRKRFKKTSNLK